VAHRTKTSVRQQRNEERAPAYRK